MISPDATSAWNEWWRHSSPVKPVCAVYLWGMAMRRRAVPVRRLIIAMALCFAGLILAASPQAGRQNQAAVPTLLVARLRLYSKAPILS